MKYATIKYCDIANGNGVRTSLFVSGCRHYCKECFNQVAWDFEYGEEFTEAVEAQILKSLEPGYIDGISLLGGEPLEPENQRGLLSFLKKVKEKFPRKEVWCYTGFTLEELLGKVESRGRCEVTDEILSYIDVLVDGKFVLELKDITLQFRGSSNQRLIRLPETLASGEIVHWQNKDPYMKSGDQPKK